MGENGRACKWGKATQASSPVWYLYALGLKVFSWLICCTPPDTAHGRGLRHPQTPNAAGLRQQPCYLAELSSPTGSSAGQGRGHAAPFQAWGHPAQHTSSPTPSPWPEHLSASFAPGSTTPGRQVCRPVGALPSAAAHKGMKSPHKQSRGLCTSALC